MLKKFLIGTLVFVGVAVMAASASADCTITTTLKVGSTGTEVSCLQTKVGATADGSFGPLTKASVMAYQSNHGLSADGVVGPLSRAVLNGSPVATTVAGCPAGALFNSMTGASCATVTSTVPGCAAGAAFSATTGASCTAVAAVAAGGAGTVDTYKLLTVPANLQQVGQGATDVKVAGISVKAGTGSDLTLTAVKVVLAKGTANHDFRKYASDVSIMVGSTKVATVSASDFTSDNSWTRTISLASGAVIKAGTTGNVYVLVSGISNLDSADATDTWTVDVTSIRYADAQGAIVSEDPATAARTFSFETLATANSLELKLSESTNNPVAQVVKVSTTAATNNVSLMKANLKVTGGAMTLKELTTTITPTGTGELATIASQFTLKVDGTEVQALNSTDCLGVGLTTAGGDICDGDVSGQAAGDYHFNLIDTPLSVGTHTVEILANLYHTGTAFVVGDTLTATTLAASNVVAQDANGDTLSGGTVLVGTVSGKAQAFRTTGINATLVSTTANVATGASGAKDIGTGTITFDVTAFGGDMYIDGTKPDATGTATDLLTVNNPASGAATIDAAITSPTGATMTGTLNADSRFLVTEGSTQRFTITVVVTPVTAGGLHSVSLTNIKYAVTDVSGTTSYTTNLSNFVTPNMNLKLTN